MIYRTPVSVAALSTPDADPYIYAREAQIRTRASGLAEAVRKAEAELDAATTPVAQPHGGEAVIPIVRLDNCAGFIRTRVQLPELYRARFPKLPREIVVKV